MGLSYLLFEELLTGLQRKAEYFSDLYLVKEKSLLGIQSKDIKVKKDLQTSKFASNHLLFFYCYKWHISRNQK